MSTEDALRARIAELEARLARTQEMSDRVLEAVPGGVVTRASETA